MGIEQLGEISFNVQSLADSLQLTTSEVYSLWDDARAVNHIMELRLARHLNAELVAGNRSYDLLWNNDRFEVKVLSKRLDFCRSSLKGKKFEAIPFLAWLDTIQAFVTYDIQGFPLCPVYGVSTRLVKGWWNEGKLTDRASMSRASFLREMEAFCS